MGIISEANTNGTLQITIPMRAAKELGWKAGTTITPVLLKGKRTDGTEVPFALVYHIPSGTNGVKLAVSKDASTFKSMPAEEV